MRTDEAGALLRGLEDTSEKLLATMIKLLKFVV
jgi:hypothetical protein